MMMSDTLLRLKEYVQCDSTYIKFENGINYTISFKDAYIAIKKSNDY